MPAGRPYPGDIDFKSSMGILPQHFWPSRVAWDQRCLRCNHLTQIQKLRLVSEPTQCQAKADVARPGEGQEDAAEELLLLVHHLAPLC